MIEVRRRSEPSATVRELAGVYEQLEDWHNAQTFFEVGPFPRDGDVALATKATAMKDKAIDSDLKALRLALPRIPSNEELNPALAARRADRLAEQVEESERS